MTTPRDPRPSIRGGGLPRDRDPRLAGEPEDLPGEERWSPSDRYVIERLRRDEGQAASREEIRTWDPGPRRTRPVWASARLALVLAALLVGLVVAAVLVSGYGRSTGVLPGASPSVDATTAPLTARPATPSPEPSREPSPTPTPARVEVVVQPGDTLTSIAREFDTKPRSIAFWNRDRYPTLDPESPDYAPDTIQIGWTLVIHPGEVYAEPGASPSQAAASPEASGGGSPASPSPGG